MFFTKMMELVDMLGLGSSSFRVGVQVPFLVLQILSRIVTLDKTKKYLYYN